MAGTGPIFDGDAPGPLAFGGAQDELGHPPSISEETNPPLSEKVTIFREQIDAARMTSIFDSIRQDSLVRPSEGISISFVGCVLEEHAQMVLGTRMRASRCVEELSIRSSGEVGNRLRLGVISPLRKNFFKFRCWPGMLLWDGCVFFVARLVFFASA